MLEAGEDARYIARRLVILASEDVGIADSMGLVVADAAARAVEFVGLPEAGLNLAHAVIYLATAPKSNTIMAGLSRAIDDVRQRPAGAVPLPLRSVHPISATSCARVWLSLSPQRPVGLRRPGVPSTRDRRRARLGRAAGLLPALAPRRRGRNQRPPEAWWGDAPYDREDWWKFEKFRDPER
jgi:hypothetical protein